MIQLSHLSHHEIAARLQHLRDGVDEIAAILGDARIPASRQAARALLVLLGENESYTHTLPRPVLVKDVPELAEVLLPQSIDWATVSILRRRNDG
jgi:hypothetical protein